MTTAFDTAKSAILGNPVDPKKKPSKTGVVKAFQQMQVQIDGAQSGALVFGLKSQMTATVVVPSANIMAWVVGDPVTANNGVYRNTGTAIAAVWTRITDVPQYVITGLNVGAGTANTIQITTDLPVPVSDGRTLIIVPVLADNTISPPTVSINSEAAMNIVTNSGVDVVVGGIKAGQFLVGVKAAGKFRLLSDQASAAVVAQAEAAAAAAIAAANSINQRIYSSVALAAADTIPAIVKRVRTQFFNPNYAVPATLVGGANYRRISFASLTGVPTAAYFRSVDRFMPDGTTDNTNGGYWIIDEVIFNPEMFGAVQDFNGTTGTDAATALAAMIGTAKVFLTPMELRSGKGYFTNSSLTVTNMTLVMRGDNFGASSIVFNNVGDGLVISQDNYLHPTSLEGFSIFTIRQEPGTALKVTYTSADSIGNRNVPRCKVIDVECRGFDIFSHGWTKGYLFTDVHRAQIIRPQICGRRNLPAGGLAQYLNMVIGIEIVGTYPPTLTAAPSDILISNPRLDQMSMGIKSSGEVEGLLIETPIIVAVGSGVTADYATGRPWVKVCGGHMNIFDFGVNLKNAPQSSISDMLIYKFQDTIATTYGINLDACDDSSISDNAFYNLAANAGTNGEWNAINVVNSVGVQIGDLRHIKPSKTLMVGGTSSGIDITGKFTIRGTYTGATVARIDDTSTGPNDFSDNNRTISNVTNAGLVNLTASTPAASAQTVTLNVCKGEKYLVVGEIEATKGGAAGQFLTQLAGIAGGGAAFTWGAAGTTITARNDYAASAAIGQSVTGILNITTSGTLTVQVVGTVTGSSATIAANKSQLTVIRL